MDKKLYGFENLLGIIEALPEKKPDNTPLRNLMPGVWPTLGDLRKLVASQQGVEGGRATQCCCPQGSICEFFKEDECLYGEI